MSKINYCPNCKSNKVNYFKWEKQFYCQNCKSWFKKALTQLKINFDGVGK